jgi:hypothetical protein
MTLQDTISVNDNYSDVHINPHYTIKNEVSRQTSNKKYSCQSYDIIITGIALDFYCKSKEVAMTASNYPFGSKNEFMIRKSILPNQITSIVENAINFYECILSNDNKKKEKWYYHPILIWIKNRLIAIFDNILSSLTIVIILYYAPSLLDWVISICQSLLQLVNNSK